MANIAFSTTSDNFLQDPTLLVFLESHSINTSSRYGIQIPRSQHIRVVTRPVAWVTNKQLLQNNVCYIKTCHPKANWMLHPLLSDSRDNMAVMTMYAVSYHEYRRTVKDHSDVRTDLFRDESISLPATSLTETSDEKFEASLWY